MRRTYYYYIGVYEKDGIKLVTAIDNKTKVCVWGNKSGTKKPLQMAKSVADDISEALVMNGHCAVAIKSVSKLESAIFI